MVYASGACGACGVVCASGACNPWEDGHREWRPTPSSVACALVAAYTLWEGGIRRVWFPPPPSWGAWACGAVYSPWEGGADHPGPLRGQSPP